MTKHERRAGLLLILLGAACAYYGYSVLTIGTINQPGPGFFPFLSGLGIVILCLIWLLGNQELVRDSKPFLIKEQVKRPAIAAAIIIAYTALMEPLGYFTSSVIFLASWQVFIEHEKWKKVLIVTGAGTVLTYLLFVHLLGVALPEFGM